MQTRGKFGAAIAIALFGAVGCAEAAANVVFAFQQDGNDVVATAAGTFNVALATAYGTSGGFGGYLIPDAAFFGIGLPGSVVNYGISGAPNELGSAIGPYYFSSISGISVGMNGGASIIFLSTSYVSGTPFSATATFQNASLASLGLTPSNYNFSAGRNDIRLTIGQAGAAVPEPAIWLEMVIGFGALGPALRWRPRLRTRFT